jgi:hypothetical protein
MLPVIAICVGVAVLLLILHDAFEVMLLPRRVKSRMRIVRYFFDAAWAIWRLTATRLPRGVRQHFLGFFGPLSLVALLMVWAAGLIAAYGMLFWGLQQNKPSLGAFSDDLYFSGVTFFTLGYGDIVPRGAWGKVISVLEAGTGLGFIAIVIGYLPVLYQLFSRHEAQVLLLDSVAGSPPSAVTLLCRFAEGRGLSRLDGLLKDWQQWSAELLESHLSYPMLAYYRSQHDNQSWLAALTSIMDACVLVMTGFDGIPTFQATLTFATTRLALVETSRVLGSRLKQESRLSQDAYGALRQRLAEAELRFVDEADACERIAAFVDTYEPFINGIANHLLLELPPWSVDREQLDNWMRSPRGKTARRLLDTVDPKPEDEKPRSGQ